MARRLAVLVVAALGACSSKAADPPLAEALPGEWEVWCRTDREGASSCPGREKDGLYKVFQPDGTLVSGARQGSTMEGRWGLERDELTLTFEGGGMKLTERYRARIADGRLVLWYPSGEFGTVLGRKGATFAAAPTKVTTTSGVTSGAIGGVRYQMMLPAGYRLTRDDNNRQIWSPSGDGFEVRLSLGPRAQTEVNGEWVTPPCDATDDGIGSSSQTIDGVERTTSISRSRCLGKQSLHCSVSHTRGYVEDGERDLASAICKAMSVDAT